jgi:uncharacterized protein
MVTKILIEVAFATPQKQSLISIEVDEGSTIESVIRASGVLDLYPEIDLSRNKVGIFSEPRVLTDKVVAGDRIEIYRELMVDPKELRRQKANALKK